MWLLKCFINLCLFFFFFCGLSRVAFSIETMDGMLRSLLFFGIFDAKCIKIAL